MSSKPRCSSTFFFTWCLRHLKLSYDANRIHCSHPPVSQTASSSPSPYLIDWHHPYLAVQERNSGTNHRSLSFIPLFPISHQFYFLNISWVPNSITVPRLRLESCILCITVSLPLPAPTHTHTPGSWPPGWLLSDSFSDYSQSSCIWSQHSAQNPLKAFLPFVWNPNLALKVIQRCFQAASHFSPFVLSVLATLAFF